MQDVGGKDEGGVREEGRRFDENVTSNVPA